VECCAPRPRQRCDGHAPPKRAACGARRHDGLPDRLTTALIEASSSRPSFDAGVALARFEGFVGALPRTTFPLAVAPLAGSFAGGREAERMIAVQTDKTRMHGLVPGLDVPDDHSSYMSLGFWRACPPMRWAGPRSFGHPGSGGSPLTRRGRRALVRSGLSPTLQDRPWRSHGIRCFARRDEATENHQLARSRTGNPLSRKRRCHVDQDARPVNALTTTFTSPSPSRSTSKSKSTSTLRAPPVASAESRY
jgi:hypothetical protein